MGEDFAAEMCPQVFTARCPWALCRGVQQSSGVLPFSVGSRQVCEFVWSLLLVHRNEVKIKIKKMKRTVLESKMGLRPRTCVLVPFPSGIFGLTPVREMEQHSSSEVKPDGR